MDKITGVLDALQNIFGKGMLLAGFLPVSLLLAISWILACWQSAACRDLSEYFLRAKITEQFEMGVVCLLLISMVSFVFWLLNPWFRQVLEGRIWPLFVQDWLADSHRKSLRSLQATVQDALHEVGLYRQSTAEWPRQLAAASTGTGPAFTDANLVRDYSQLQSRFDRYETVPQAELVPFRDRLESELRVTSPTNVPDLNRILDDFCNTMLPAGADRAERELYRRLTDRTFRYPAKPKNVGPTKLANIQEAQRDYIASNYGIDVSLFWADLQKVAAADEKFAPALENAKTRLDFSVAMTAIAAIFTIYWIILNIWFGSEPLVYTLVAALGLFAILVCQRLVFINYVAFAETVRTAVELFRFQLLQALHLRLPANDREEQQIWLDLARRLETGAQIDIPYEHAHLHP
jgi:hypothetical protein